MKNGTSTSNQTEQEQIINDMKNFEIKASDPIKLKGGHDKIMLDFIKEFARVPERISIERYQNENNKIVIKIYFRKAKVVKE